MMGLQLACVERPDLAEVAWTNRTVIEDSETLFTSGDQLRGSGRFRMVDLLTGLDSKEHYVIEFRFLAPTSSFILHSHFSGFHRRDGVEVQFKPGEEGKSVHVLVSTPDFPAREVGVIEEVPLQSIVRFRVELHDGVKDGIHLFVWVDQISFQGEILRRLDIVASGFLNDINTEEDQEVFFSHGRGLSWGAELNQVELRSFEREAPYVQ